MPIPKNIVDDGLRLWNEDKKNITKTLQITIPEHMRFEKEIVRLLNMSDENQSENYKLLAFFIRKEKHVFKIFTDDVLCIEHFYKEIPNQLIIQLKTLSDKILLFVAYVHIRDEVQSEYLLN